MTDGGAPGYLERAGGTRIAYRKTEGRVPGVVFFPGFRSDMQGGKALALEAICRQDGRAYLRFDYSGHGESDGRFEDGTVGDWLADCLDAIDRLTEGPQVLVGSSMGGWMMLLVARARTERIAGMVGVAVAPDFTERLMWQRMPESVKKTLRTDGVWYEPSDYDPEPTPITMRLIEEGRNHLLLDGPVDVPCPTRLIHGMKDPDVPWQHSLAVAEALTATDVEIALVKGGDHRLSEPHDLDRLCRTVRDVCALAETG